MKISCVCPHCNQEVTIDGIKIMIDGKLAGKAIPTITTTPTTTTSKFKHYIGWDSKDKPNVVNPAPPPPPTQSAEEFSKILDSSLKKSQVPIPPPPPTKIDKELNNYLKEEKAREQIKIAGTVPPSPPPVQLKQPVNVSESIIKIDKPLKLPEDKPKEIDDILKQPSVDLSTSTIDAIGREIAKRIAEFKSKGTCLICNINPGNKENLICDSCLQNIVSKKVIEEHKEEEKRQVVW